ncbi:hypothetical protein NG2371_07182 [Nocardia gamkensis]|nr:hypothetical protein [Nocardia gamkensis]
MPPVPRGQPACARVDFVEQAGLVGDGQAGVDDSDQVMSRVGQRRRPPPMLAIDHGVSRRLIGPAIGHVDHAHLAHVPRRGHPLSPPLVEFPLIGVIGEDLPHADRGDIGIRLALAGVRRLGVRPFEYCGHASISLSWNEIRWSQAGGQARPGGVWGQVPGISQQPDCGSADLALAGQAPAVLLHHRVCLRAGQRSGVVTGPPIPCRPSEEPFSRGGQHVRARQVEQIVDIDLL